MRNTPIMIAVCFVLALNSISRAAEEKPEPRTISTSGEAVVYVVPDEVIVSFGVETFNADLDVSKSQNDTASKKVLAAVVKDVGIDEKCIQTDALSLEIRYRDGGRLSSGIEGYVARRSYSVTIKDVKKLQPVIDAALKNGANQLMGVEYRTRELRKYRDQARKMAIKAALEKAQALSAELQCGIGSPRTIGEGYAGWGYSGGWGRANGQYNAMAQNAMQQAPAGGEGDDGATSPLGQIGVQASVSVVFDLIPDAQPAKAKPDAAK